MTWTVETLNTTVDKEIEALPADMRARLVRIAELIATAGLENVHAPHIKHIEAQLWEMRLKGKRMAITGAVCDGKTETGRDCAGLHQENRENTAPRD